MPTRFTIAIPTHDRRETVLLAVRSALAQTRPPEQVLVLCDGCRDGTADALRGLASSRVEALELPKAPGYAYAHRNRSLELARGEAILWLADDDLLMPDHLERIGELWDTDRFDLVQADAVIVHPDDTLEWCGADWSLPFPRARLATANTNPMTSVSLRVELARAIGGWDAARPSAADLDLWLRALAAGARSARSLEPTVLHFRARGREQAWPLRVRQNGAWFARLGDPAGLVELRILLRQAMGEREAKLEQHVASLEQHAAVLEQHVPSLQQHLAALERHVAGLQQALDAAQHELAAAHEHVCELEASRAAMQTHAEQLARTLTRIYNGGWWRLRRRMLPLMRVVGRGG